MKKQWRMVLISGCVLVALLLTWLAATLLKPSETTATTTYTTLEPMFKYDAAAIDHVDFQSAKGGCTVSTQETKDKDGKTSVIWVLKSEKNYPFSQDIINEMGLMATQISISEDIASGVTDLSPYGLDKPVATMKIYLKSGESHVVKFGNVVVSGYYNYAMLDDSGRVCKIPSTTVDQAKRTLLDFLSKDKVVGIKTKELTHLEFYRARDNISLVMDCVLKGEATADTSYLDFTLLSPIRRSGSIDSLNTLATQATTVTANSFFELEPADLSVYGLDKPAYRFVMKSGDKTVELKIGSKMLDSESYFAMSSEIPAVFICKVEDLAMIDVSLMDMLDRLFMLQNIWQVERVECDILGTQFYSDITMGENQKADEESVVFKLDGQNAKIFDQDEHSLFSKLLYERLISPMIAGLDVDAKPVNTHDATIRFFIREDQKNSVPAHQKVVEFSRRDDYTYYVFIDNIYTGFYINKSDAITRQDEGDEGILAGYKKLKYAMAHAVDGVFDTTKGYQID
jgi:hypothetical protein